MWRWRFTRPEKAALVALIALGSAALPGARADLPASSTGAATKEGGDLIWSEARADVDAGRYAEAIPKLERLIARYPGHPGYTEAHWLLARSHLQLDRPDRARPLLKTYVEARGRTPQGLDARIELARAQLALEQSSEALLTAEEALKLLGKVRGGAEHHRQARALVLKAQALIELDRDERAGPALDSARKLLPPRGLPDLRGELLETDLELKLRHCARFPSKGPLEEEQARDQLGRRGNCLAGALLVYRDTLANDDAPSVGSASRKLAAAYRAYHEACARPPAPPRLKPKDRTRAQLEAYSRELAAALKSECRQKTSQSLELLKSFLPSIPAGSAEPARKTAAELERLL